MHTVYLSQIKRALAAAAIVTIALGLLTPQAKATLSRAPHNDAGRQVAHAPFATYMLDDGTAEDSVGLTAGGNLLCLNSFAITGGQNIITAIEIAWGTPAFPDPTLDGLPYTAVLWSDPNGDGSPTDAVVLSTMVGVVANQGTNTFIISPITPTAVSTSNFFVGFVINHAAGQFPAAFDTDAPTLPMRSWVSVGGDINNLSDAFPIEDAGLVGNWLIRADAVPEPTTYALVGLGLAGIAFLRRRATK